MSIQTGDIFIRLGKNLNSEILKQYEKEKEKNPFETYSGFIKKMLWRQSKNDNKVL